MTPEQRAITAHRARVAAGKERNRRAAERRNARLLQAEPEPVQYSAAYLERLDRDFGAALCGIVWEVLKLGFLFMALLLSVGHKQ